MPSSNNYQQPHISKSEEWVCICHQLQIRFLNSLAMLSPVSGWHKLHHFIMGWPHLSEIVTSLSQSHNKTNTVLLSANLIRLSFCFSLWNCQQNYQTGIIADLPTSILSYLYLFLTVYTWQRRWCFTRFHLHLILKLGRWGKIFGKAQVEN